jgi:gamma-glutamyl-gamma-aminobutyrate hydrolase PuuD
VSRGARVGLTQRVEDFPARGERRDALDQAWTPFLARAGLTPVPIPNRLADPASYVEALDLALVILTGGNDLASLPGAVHAAPERDATEPAIVDHAATHRLPVLGVCRGLQLLVARAGGVLRPVTGHVGTPHPIERSGRGRFPLRTSAVSSYHDWGVRPDEVGVGLEVLACAPDGTVEAVADPDRPIVGVMWHPERDPADPVDLALVTALVAGG